MSNSSKQINQMVNFILQEADEKANEIRIKTEHDFNLEKQILIHNAKVRIVEDMAKKDKQRKIEDRIAQSAAIGAKKTKAMDFREGLLKDLINSAKSKIKNVSSNKAGYQELLKKLIIQAMIKIDETNIEIQCRQVDLSLVQQVAGPAIAEYIQMLKVQCGETTNVQYVVSTENFLPADSSGGVLLRGYAGRIVCDNTLDARLDLVFHALKPVIKQKCFSTK